MNAHIALLRGINVGGKHVLPMKALVALLEELGCTGVRTYIQSGNAVFRHRAAAPALAKKIRAAVGREFGFEPEVLLLTRAQLERAARGNPFRKGEPDPRKLHVVFLASAPKRPDLASLEELKAPDERFELAGSVFYLHAPSGIARSKLAARIDKALGVPTTARNARTVERLLELASSVDPG